jgi:twinkle protein
MGQEQPTLGPKGVEAFTRRQIRPETAARFEIYTGKSVGGKVEPSKDGNIIVFPFIEDDRVVGEKYRGPNKKFWQRTGGKRTFWNAEALDLAAGGELIITEGELDALTAIDCGFDRTVSVPDGAPSAEVTQDDPEHGKFSYLWSNRQKLAEIKTFVLAVDNDEPGQILAAELVRRLSTARCKHVEYPEGCKDLNDVRMQHGPEAVAAVLNNAKAYPLRGIYHLSDYPDRPALRVCETGWVTLDYLLKPFLGGLMVVTGIPGHGKSSWTTHLVANLCEANGWRAAIFSPEMPLIPHLRDKLRGIRMDKAIDGMTKSELAQADAWIEDKFIFLDADPAGMWDAEDRTLDWIIDKATDAVMRDGIRVLLIDPWNEIEHSVRKGELTTEYIGRGIRELRRFAQHRDVVVIIVAHPTKQIGDEKRAPGLYDIDGSAHWANKPDHGVSIYRASDDGNQTEVHVTKVRFGTTGKRGKVTLKYDSATERYALLEPLLPVDGL